jgi:hypothetical protein
MVKSRAIVALGIAVAALAGPARADEPDVAPDVASPGQVYSTSFAPLSPGAAIAIRPLDNTRANITLGQHFATALKRRAMRVQTMPAPFVLNFETEVDQAIRRDDRSAATTSGSSREDTPPNRLGDEQDRGMLRYILTATLDDERTGQRLWHGKVVYSGAPADEASMLAGMAAILGEQVGETVRLRRFILD